MMVNTKLLAWIFSVLLREGGSRWQSKAYSVEVTRDNKKRPQWIPPGGLVVKITIGLSVLLIHKEEGQSFKKPR